MNRDNAIAYTPAQLKVLRDRWTTEEGKKRRRAIQSMLEQGHVDFGDQATFPTDGMFPAVPPGKDLRGITLSAQFANNLNLNDMHLSGARLEGCNLTGANFSFSHLEYVSFSGSILHNAVFRGAFLEHPYFVNAKLDGIDLSEAVINSVEVKSLPTFMSGGFADFSKSVGSIDQPYMFYSIIKSKYRSLGKYDEMIPFHLMEMRARRDDRYSDPKTGRRTFRWYLDWICFDLVCGYGERITNVLCTSGIVVLLYSFLYMVYPLLAPPPENQTVRWLDYLYFSAVNFSNLGSQDLLPFNLYHRFLMFSESVLGLFIVTMTIVIFTRRVIRE
jgi:hypothetical protein